MAKKKQPYKKGEKVCADLMEKIEGFEKQLEALKSAVRNTTLEKNDIKPETKKNYHI